MAQVAPSKSTTCARCDAALDTTSAADLGCMVCLLQLAFQKSAALPESENFGQYVIAKREDGRAWELGRGAMGVTYRALDTSLRRAVALKLIKADFAGRESDTRERFMREARAAGALRHPNVATVYQSGMDEQTGQCFYAMELVEGETLEERVRRSGPLDVPSVIEIARQITKALAAAEKRGLVHRDLKPANVMIATGEDDDKLAVKVIDFGLAKALAETPDARALTRGEFIGTPAFASPEQFTNAPIDVRSDIYSLGATLWYLLTGHMPFGDRASTTPPVAQLKAVHVPPRLIGLLLSMLAVEPAARPPARDLAQRLEIIHDRITRRKNLPVSWAIAAAFIALAAGATVFFVHPLQNATGAIPEKGLAVLPFADLSEDKSNAYFTSGIHDDLLVNLSKIANLKVISRNSVQSFKGGSRNVHEIAKELGVHAIVEGSVRRSGGQTRINVELIDASSEAQLWAQTYDRQMTDAFAIQSEVAFQIASALKAKLTAEEDARLRRLPTKNGEAYLCYLEANDYYAGREKLKPDLERAAKLFEKAIQLDPSFALAYAQLSRTESVIDSYHEGRPLHRAQALAAAREALRLQPDLPEGHMALAEDYWRALVTTGEPDFDGALREYEIARHGLPNDADIYSAVGRILRNQGKWKESTASFARAAALDPRFADRWHRLCGSLQLTRNYPAAADAFARAIALEPNSWMFECQRAFLDVWWKGDLTSLQHLREPTGAAPENRETENRFAVKEFLRQYGAAEDILRQDTRETLTWDGYPIPKSFLFGQLYFVKGDREKARAAFAAALPVIESGARDKPNDWGLFLVAEAYAGMGRNDEAIRAGKRATELMPESKSAWHGGGRLADLAHIYAMLSDADHALPILTHLLSIPSETHKEQLRYDPIWDPIRRDPRFQHLLAEPEHVFPVALQ